MYAVDLHAHTRFFHPLRARPTPYDPVGARLLAGAAAAAGLDAVVVTNHDYHRPFQVGPVSLLPGVEISTTRGHVLVIGPDPPPATNPGEMVPEEAVELAHDHGCAAVVPHPFRNSTVREVDAPFDAVELNGKHPDTHADARAMAVERGLPLTGGSDAHYPFEVGRAYTRVDADELTAASVADAIRDGRIDPVVARRPVDHVLGALYRRIHRLKGYR